MPEYTTRTGIFGVTATALNAPGSRSVYRAQALEFERLGAAWMRQMPSSSRYRTSPAWVMPA